MNLTSYESPIPSSRVTTLEPGHRVLGARGHGNFGEGCGGLEALVSRHHRLRPDRGCMKGVLQPLPWEPDSGNRRVVIALVRKGEATGEQETQRGVRL
jgi:hypothetical protein